MITNIGARRIRHGFEIVLDAAPRKAAILALLAIALGLAPVVAAWLLKLVLDELATEREWTVLLGLGVALAAAGIAAGVVPRLNQYIENAMTRAVRLVTAGRLFGAVNSRLRGLKAIEDPELHDRLRSAQNSGAQAPSEIVSSVLLMARQLITALGFVGTLLVMNPLLGGLVAASSIPMVRAEVVLARQRAVAMHRIVRYSRRQLFYSNLLVSPREAKEVRLFNLGEHFRERLLREQRAINSTEQQVDRRDLHVQTILMGLAAIISGIGLVWAIGAAVAGGLTVGDVSVLVAAVAGVQAAIAGIVQAYGRIHEAQLMLEHYDAILNATSDLPGPSVARSAPPLRKGIEVRDVWFRYGEGRPWVLRGVSFRIPAGQTIGLVGRNGVGKSTLVKLLCRLYDPTRGSITWDGVDLREFDLTSLRERIGVVFQDYAVYELSARENIGLGDLSRLEDLEAIQEAAQLAGAHSTITALPAGYETLITRMYVNDDDLKNPDTGVLLSGGQGQRLALARTFMRGSRDLLIFDEPSAGLDAAAEAEMKERLHGFRVGSAMLIISHRLNLLRDADSLLVLRSGQLIEQGGHTELMAAGGEYAKLFKTQARGYALVSEGSN